MMGHVHGSADVPASASGRYVKRLAAAFAIAATFMVVEATLAVITGSLALLSDAAHMLTDVFGIGMALTAILIAQRARPNSTRTFGMYRGEVFAALFNALLLFGVAGYVLYEAVRRFADPPEVAGLPVMLAATVGIGANLVSFLLLRSGAKESLNLRGAYLEVLADLLASVGVLISGAITLLTGWRYADPLMGVAIAVFVLPRALSLARRSLRILFQHAPERIDVDELATRLTGLDDVIGVHDLHVWTLTSGMDVASVHLTVADDAEQPDVLERARQMLWREYDIRHSTVQVEPPETAENCDPLA
ncbi:cation diffusion facilitator family transporter [Haloechinothrix sp. LS1_15]|uniref:cation diffusion facilitator family transporter n=1 Tax=Haloechinothrix sp. LS1_15 TaxID=2652248 RepID=UPI0029441F02|nr:cation diffusion facilitator family transporter [Haloechinothrix sp. LS1_15]MDV6011767.1 cation transporter [Haloechinothrix sp. LS1_15]